MLVSEILFPVNVQRRMLAKATEERQEEMKYRRRQKMFAVLGNSLVSQVWKETEHEAIQHA